MTVKMTDKTLASDESDGSDGKNKNFSSDQKNKNSCEKIFSKEEKFEKIHHTRQIHH
jgi:hypothetical protein